MIKGPVDLQPRLTGDLVELRPLRESDWQALYAVASDPAIWAVHPAHDRHEETVFRAFFDEAIAGKGALVAIDKATGHVVGSSRYGLDRAEAGEVEIGWTFLARSHWGGAVNRDMKRLMLAHAFAFADTAIFLVGDTNWRSRRAMEKIGGMLLNRTHRAVMAGRDVVHLIYAIDADAFARSPLALRQKTA